MNKATIKTNIPNNTHAGRARLLEHIADRVDASRYFIDEHAGYGKGELEYNIYLRKGSYSGGVSSFSLFDSIRLIDQTVRVPRATEKQLREHLEDVFNRADELMRLLDAVSDQWTAQPRALGQVKYYADTYQIHVADGYDVAVDIQTKAEKLITVSSHYMTKGLDAYNGTVTEYKYQEYHPDMNLTAVLEKYSQLTREQLDEMHQAQKEQADELERQAREQRAREMEEEKRKKQETVDALNLGEKPYLLLQFNHSDDSDIMTDYFSTKLDNVQVLGEYDAPIRDTFAGGRMDIWRLLRDKGIHIDGLKYKALGGIMGIQNTKYTGSGSYVEVKMVSREALMRDSYTLAAIARGKQTAETTV